MAVPGALVPTAHRARTSCRRNGAALGDGLWSAPRARLGPWTNPSHALCSYLCGTMAGTRGRGCWPWCWEGCLASRSTCRRFCYRPALQRRGGGLLSPDGPPASSQKPQNHCSLLLSAKPQVPGPQRPLPPASSELLLGPATPAGPPPVCNSSQTHPGPPFPVTFSQHLPL